ncbi:MAG TPA: tRNA (guanosine(37)-N1)-methyltransferase TrmD [Acidobacteriaceae bacterium]|nr:tRNA (guanosine(37)-N1)-methyltransferase TrmD [Acidobacteriaceae bacterium]
MHFDIITIFPQFFDGPFRFGVLGRALESGRVQLGIHSLREFTEDRHKTVDDRPFGGGEGMVLKPEPLFRAVESLGMPEKTVRDTARERVVLLSPQGSRFNQKLAREMVGLERLVFLCGRYEGVDERVNDFLADMEISIGDYVLSGGELAAAVVIDSITRLLPGVLGNKQSARNESFGSDEASTSAPGPNGPPTSTCDSLGLLDYPHYTRPPHFRDYRVPAVLSCGNHEEIRRWRRERALAKTLRNRPELLTEADLSHEDRRILERLQG